MRKILLQVALILLAFHCSAANLYAVEVPSTETSSQTKTVQHVKILQYGTDYKDMKAASITEKWFDTANGNRRTDYFGYSLPPTVSEHPLDQIKYSKKFVTENGQKIISIQLREDGQVKGTLRQYKSLPHEYSDLFTRYKEDYESAPLNNTWENLGSNVIQGIKVSKVRMAVVLTFGGNAGQRTNETVIAYLDTATGLPVKEEVYIGIDAKEPAIIRIYQFDQVDDQNGRLFEDYGGVELEEVQANF